MQTIAFAASPNYARAQAVGGSVVAADTSVAFPANLSALGIGGFGSVAMSNVYGVTRKLYLKGGAPIDTSFAELLAKAELAAA